MSDKIQYSISKTYEKYLVRKIEDTKLRNNLVENLKEILKSVDFGTDTTLHFQCPINTYDKILDSHIDYDAIDKIAKHLGYNGGIKIRMSSSLKRSGIYTYEDLVRLRENSLARIVRKEAKERFKNDFEKLLGRKHPNMFGRRSAKVLVTHLKSKGLLDYFQDS